jgi:hypothetical protein
MYGLEISFIWYRTGLSNTKCATHGNDSVLTISNKFTRHSFLSEGFSFVCDSRKRKTNIEVQSLLNYTGVSNASSIRQRSATTVVRIVIPLIPVAFHASQAIVSVIGFHIAIGLLFEVRDF